MNICVSSYKVFRRIDDLRLQVYMADKFKKINKLKHTNHTFLLEMR